MFPTLARRALPVLFASLLAACGGGGSDDADDDTGTTPPPAATPTATIAVAPAALTVVAGSSGTATLTLTRGGGFAGAVSVAASGAPTGVTVSAPEIAASGTTSTVTLAVASTAAVGSSTVTFTGTATGVTVAPVTLALTVQAAPVVPAGVTAIGAGILGEATGDQAGTAVSLSADGSRLAVGARFNDGAAGANSGHVRVYQRSGSTWTQLGGDIDGEAANDSSGIAVALSSDGSRVVVGAYLNGPGFTAAGQVRVYELVSGAWVQVGADLDGGFSQGLGFAVAVSSDGRRIVAGAPGVNNTNGYANVYEQVGSAWVQMGATIAVPGASEFAQAVSMSADGTRVALGAPGAESSTRPGTTYVFQWNGSAWLALGAPIVGEANGNTAGTSVSLSSDGSRIAIGAPENRDANLGAPGSGAGQVRVYELVAGAWIQLGADIDGRYTTNGNQFGFSVALSGDGARLVASAFEGSAARVYVLANGAWTQTGTDLVDAGPAQSVAMSADGKTATVGFTYVQSFTGRTQVYTVTP